MILRFYAVSTLYVLPILRLLQTAVLEAYSTLGFHGWEWSSYLVKPGVSGVVSGVLVLQEPIEVSQVSRLHAQCNSVLSNVAHVLQHSQPVTPRLRADELKTRCLQ